MAWIGRIRREFSQTHLLGIMRYKFKFPEKYRDTFIEKWGRFISISSLLYVAYEVEMNNWNKYFMGMI
jgi:hypothetical protein